jgi:hypothetical protein
MTIRYDFDTSPYFERVAATLIRCHGDEAFALADQVIRKLKVSGDAEGIFLWEGVRSAMYDTVVDAMSDRIAIPADSADAHNFLSH